MCNQNGTKYLTVIDKKYALSERKNLEFALVGLYAGVNIKGIIEKGEFKVHVYRSISYTCLTPKFGSNAMHKSQNGTECLKNEYIKKAEKKYK